MSTFIGGFVSKKDSNLNVYLNEENVGVAYDWHRSSIYLISSINNHYISD